MYELGEWLIFAARLFMLVVGFLGASWAMGTAVSWLIGQLGKHVQMYSLLIDFAFSYKQFKQYQRDIRRDSGKTSD